MSLREASDSYLNIKWDLLLVDQDLGLLDQFGREELLSIELELSARSLRRSERPLAGQG